MAKDSELTDLPTSQARYYSSPHCWHCRTNYPAFSSAMYPKPRLDKPPHPDPDDSSRRQDPPKPQPKVATPLVLVLDCRSFKHAKPLVHRALPSFGRLKPSQLPAAPFSLQDLESRSNLSSNVAG